MTTSTYAPAPVRPEELAAAIVRELTDRTPRPAVHTGPRGGAVMIGAGERATGGAVVLAAVDDDSNPGHILDYAAGEAGRLAVPLRVVHVWTGNATRPAGVRLSRHDRISDADRLLSAIFYDYLPVEQAQATERQILHDYDPVRALITLSGSAALVVVAAQSGTTTGEGPLGETVRALLGRTACPLAVLPAAAADPRESLCGW